MPAPFLRCCLMSPMKYEDIKIGEIYSFNRKISKKDVLVFAKLTGDFNALHVNEIFGRKSIFKKNVVHGMLVGSLFSTLVGMHCPGENGLYLSQSLNFKSPLFYEDEVTVRGTVIDKNDSVKVLVLKTEILRDGKITIQGEARVKILDEVLDK